jgi:hypothetical protein
MVRCQPAVANQPLLHLRARLRFGRDRRALQGGGQKRQPRYRPTAKPEPNRRGALQSRSPVGDRCRWLSDGCPVPRRWQPTLCVCQAWSCATCHRPGRAACRPWHGDPPLRPSHNGMDAASRSVKSVSKGTNVALRLQSRPSRDKSGWPRPKFKTASKRRPNTPS